MDTHSKIISRFPKDKYNFGLYNSDLTFLNEYSNPGRGFNINKFYSNLDRLIKLKDSFEYEYSNTQDLIELSRKKKDEYDINTMMYPLNSNANDIPIPYSKPNKANPFAKNQNKAIPIKDVLANLERMPPPPPPSGQMKPLKPPPSKKQLMEDMLAAQQNIKHPNSNSNSSHEDEYNEAFHFGKIYKLTITDKDSSKYNYYITLRQDIIFSENVDNNKKYPNITLNLNNKNKKDSGLFIRNKRISGLDDKTIITMLINHHNKQKTGGRKMFSRKKNKKHIVSKRKSRKYIHD